MAAKIAFDIDEVFVRLREATQRFPQAQMFALRDQGYNSVFEQVVACILSIRTLDEVSGPAALRLFAVARTPAQIAALSVDEIDALVNTVQFSYGKAGQIRTIAAFTRDTYGQDLPADYDVLTSLKGVGPKCANLTLGVARGIPAIAVDIHVHRVTNRWGYVAATTPEASLAQLEQKLPQKYWVEINERLVPFGKRICTGRAPRCSRCPLLEMCAQVGVTSP
jgi:endonuclease-3